MSHSITCKLNQDARSHQGQAGTTFFVSLGEKNYNFKTKQNEYTNYEAALFAKDAQIGFYQSALVAGAIIEVSGTGILMEIDETGQYKPKLVIQDAKLGFVHSDQSAQPQQQHGQPVQAPQGYAPQQPQQGYNPNQPPPTPHNQPQGAYNANQQPRPQPNFNQPQR
jgi:single-strand DNA-binding protein